MTQQDKKIFLPVIAIVAVLFIIAFVSISSGTKYNKMVKEVGQYESAQAEAQKKTVDSLQKVQDSLKVIESYKDSIQIIKVITSNPNSAGGVDLNIIWKNKSKRVVKYARFQVKAINAVNDEVGCEINGSGLWGKVTGPIKSGSTYGYGTYWGCMWYNSTIKKAEIIKIELEFMDGTTVEFTV